ncbi:MAG TPA: hypothetical protein VKI44_43220 [Acetobacteraceae bacterium]|nr:hypothetical protein [Acetobacteraceae bacterium]
MEAEIDLWQRFEAGYTAPFHESFPDDPLDAGYMLELISDAAFVPVGNGTLQPVSRADVFRQFTRPLDDDPSLWEGDPPPKHEAPESADAALAFLVEQGMVVVADDEITVPARFWSGDPSTSSPNEAPTPEPT